MSDSSENVIQKTVTEFGNGGHVILPASLVGQSVEIRTISDSVSNLLQPPIHRDDIERVIQSAGKDDFEIEFDKESDRGREGTFVFTPAIRLRISLELTFEDGASRIMDLEDGRILYTTTAENPDELYEDGRDCEMAHYIEDVVVPIIGSPRIGPGGYYTCRVKWEGDAIYSTELTPREVPDGVMYLPIFTQFDSVEDYRSSFTYQLAVLLSDISKEDYDTYIDALGLTPEEFEDGISERECDYSQEEIYERATAFQV